MVKIVVPVEQTQIFFCPLAMQRGDSSVAVAVLPLFADPGTLVFEGVEVIEAVFWVGPEPPADAAVWVECPVFDPLSVRDIVALFGKD